MQDTTIPGDSASVPDAAAEPSIPGSIDTTSPLERSMLWRRIHDAAVSIGHHMDAIGLAALSLEAHVAIAGHLSSLEQAARVVRDMEITMNQQHQPMPDGVFSLADYRKKKGI